jgi:hypothetical protein
MRCLAITYQTKVKSGKSKLAGLLQALLLDFCASFYVYVNIAKNK